MADTGIYIKVIRKETIREDSSLIKLKITNKSSEVRKILAYDDIIRMNDGLLFLDRDYNIITSDNESITNSNMEKTIYVI
ncbi:hypothetical protein RirG_145140 [Rhizophagus irregularis DAOM 197198w]|uniref:Uncharacterized protein n=1 Tax=Rhizophagus irregularis (strain DAOM 197198w) TaxID=1432141 RepID=A0A015K9S2_RHIIW|nr:hypothetical protein RirG_145140 [Rhizophagus irregularis DAOM 197198w]